MSQPITARPSKKYRAVHHDGRRMTSSIHYVVIHDEEAPTAEAAAKWFENPKSEGSAHECIDANECFETLPAGLIPWAAPPLNRNGQHLELAGYARWTALLWKRNRRLLDRAAYRCAVNCKRFSVPPYFVFAKELLHGRHGVTTHAQISKAWGLSTHTDPGFGFPRRFFMRKVRAYYKELSND